MESRMDMSETRVDKLEEVGQQLQAQISKIKDFVRDEVGTVLREPERVAQPRVHQFDVASLESHVVNVPRIFLFG